MLAMPRASVLIVTDTYLPERNGAAIVTARAARGLIRRGWSVHVVAPTSTTANDDPEGPSIERVPSIGLPFYGSVRVAVRGERIIQRALEHHRPDVVFCATEFRLGRMAQEAARARHLPTASTYHTDFVRYASAYRSGVIAAPIRTLLSRFHQRSTLVFAPSQAACRDLRAMGIAHPQLWGRCVDSAQFHPGQRDADWRRQQRLVGRTTFLCVSRLAREKGVDQVIEGYLRAIRLLPVDSTQLLIVGDGPLEGALRARAAQGLAAIGRTADQIRFLGARDRERELPAIYASADAFVFASTTETLGLVVLEAMASGLPVVAPRTGGIADHLIDGGNGLDTGPDVCDGLTRAIVALSVNPTLRASLGASARLTAEAVDEARDLDRLDRRLRALARPQDVRAA